MEPSHFGWLSINLLPLEEHKIYCEVVNENEVRWPQDMLIPYNEVRRRNYMIKAAAFMTLYNMSDRRA
jgi:hypothetical protein